MQVLFRTRQDVVSQSWSEDNGNTWSEMVATDLPNPNAGTDAVTLKDGRQLLVYNHTTKKGEQPNNRNMLTVALSEDWNKWTPVMTLEKAPHKAVHSYPSLYPTFAGQVPITYT